MSKALPSSESRRDVLRFGAVGAASVLVAACVEQPPDDDATTGGTGGTTGGAGGTGGTTGGMGGTTGGRGGATGGTGGTTGGTGGTTGGTGGTTGGTGVGGAGAPGGAPGAGGTPAGGSAGVGTSGSAGNGMGGASAGQGSGGVATGGMPPMGGTGGTGGSMGGGKENNGATCAIGAIPTVSNPKLPDPFKMINGTRISSKDQWNCLRAELSAMAQAHIYGAKMPPPDELTATFSGGKLTVNMKVGSQTGSFTATISGGGSAASPVPCLITCGGSSLGTLSGVAKIDMANNSMDQESKTVASGGLVHMLYGTAAQKSGSLIGWAWGLSRIIDGLELCPEAGIDLKRIAVTGCSRNGKGALAMGAFDERVALTIPQEGGSGGPAVWRVSEAEYKAGQNIQESQEIIGEANWQGTDFKQFATRGNNKGLAVDQHTVIALCAPRAVLLIDNDIDWLGPVASYAGGKTAMKVYEALGIADRIGASVSAEHGHCSFPSSQQAYLTAFVNRFLKGMNTDTSGVDELHTQSKTTKLGSFKEADWIDWTVPTLSGNLAWDPFA
jgi:hypothetical protein